jgi:osmotically inducible protein OsmC
LIYLCRSKSIFNPIKNRTMKRTATAVWSGPGKEGSGHLTTASKTLDNTPYNWAKRFADEPGTNPEELIAAAHAGCFSMKLSFVLGNAGFTPDRLETTAAVSIESGSITGSALSLRARVPGIGAEQFKACAEEAKAQCPVSKALSVPITLDAQLA